MSINYTAKKKGGLHKIIWMHRRDLWLLFIFFGGEILKACGVIVGVARLSCNGPSHFLNNTLVTLAPKVILLHYVCLEIFLFSYLRIQTNGFCAAGYSPLLKSPSYILVRRPPQGAITGQYPCSENKMKQRLRDVRPVKRRNEQTRAATFFPLVSLQKRKRERVGQRRPCNERKQANAKIFEVSQDKCACGWYG